MRTPNNNRPPKGARMKGAGAKDGKKTIKRLLSYLMAYKFSIFAMLVCIIVSSLAGVVGNMFLRTLIDDYITPLMTQENPVFTGLLQALATMAVVYFLGILSTWFCNFTMVTVSQGVQKTIRDEMFAHMQTLPVQYFDTHTHGEIMSHYTNDIDTLRQMISQSIPQMISSAITVVAVFSAMCVTSLPMTGFVILTVIGMMAVTAFIGGRSGKYFVEQQKSIGQLNGYIEEMVDGQKVVQVFCHEAAAKADFDKCNDELFHNAKQAHTFANILMPIMGNMGHLQFALLAMFGGFLAISGISPGLTLGSIVSFLQLSKSFNMPITQISQQINSIVMALAGAERIFALLDVQSEADDGYVTLVNAEYNANGELMEAQSRTGIWAWKHPHKDGTVTYTLLRGDVRMNEVDFAYVPDKLVLHDISLYAEPGQKVAFVGATGAGKTTITNLINRFYDIADGKIRYDDININKIKKSDLRHSLGVVLQDVNLFTGTVMENIRYGRLDATDEECIAAAKLANAQGFIEMLPEKYNTVLEGDGSGLSQGQRQLISIARAAVADPPVMILDEATSSIDTRTEALVQRGMDGLMKGRTVFVIAHRLSTVQNSDVIMVLDHGHIIEKGTHDQLIAQKGNYYRLYTGAFELD